MFDCILNLPRILNMPVFRIYGGSLNMPDLLKCQGSEYGSGSEYVTFVDMPRFYIFQGTQGFEYD